MGGTVGTFRASLKITGIKQTTMGKVSVFLSCILIGVLAQSTLGRGNKPLPCADPTTDGKCCVFPFVYNGKEYNRCINDNHNSFWCSTTKNYDNDKAWGDCAPKKCPVGWHQFQKHCYRVYDYFLREWKHQDVMCRHHGGYLAIINSAEEQEFVKTLMRRHLWIGLKKGDDGKFYWRWGQKPTYTNWAPGEPNDPESYVLEDCVEMRTDGKWNNLQCRRRLGFLCKRKAYNTFLKE